MVAYRCLRRMGFQGRQTPHGFRGFGQTNCIEQLKIPRVVTEKQLAHADGNSVSRACDERGTMCRTRVFMRSAGMIH